MVHNQLASASGRRAGSWARPTTGAKEQEALGGLEAAVQRLHFLIELAKVQVSEAQVLEEVGIIGILVGEFLQVDTVLIEAAGGEELKRGGARGWTVASDVQLGRVDLGRI
jgi:hypothetical protein